MESTHVHPDDPQALSTLPHISPNYRTEAIRHPEIRIEKWGDWEIEYEFTPAAGDHGNLLVVFSSVGSTYGFGKALSGVQCNVLRIRDRFAGGTSYYVCRDMDFSVSDAVEEMITSYSERLGLSRDAVVLAGSSKGGSAALIYALKYGYRNIVASTPQYFIGSYSQGHGNLGASVLGKGEPQENVDTLDAVLPTLLAEDEDRDRNIYLVSSTRDYQYEEEVVHFLPALRKYSNFNLVMVESPALIKHAEVTRQGLSAILSIIYALTEGAAPRWGEVQIGSNDVDEPAAAAHLANLRARDTALAVLTGASLTHQQARLTGHAFIPGAAAETEDSGNAESRETKQLVLERDGKAWVADADTVAVDQLYLKYFDTYFTPYKDGGFACDARDLFESLPPGTYDVSARVASESEAIDRRVPLVAYNPIDRRSASHGFEVVLKGDRNGVRLIKRSLANGVPGGTVFSLERFLMDGQKLRVYGVFYLPGRNAEHKSHAAYYLTLQGPDTAHTFDLKPLQMTEKVRPHVRPGDFGSYGYGFFTSPDGKGVDLSALPAGTYTAQVTMSAGGSLFTHEAGRVELRQDGDPSSAWANGTQEEVKTSERKTLRARLWRP
ncbi:hypothetical protein [Streptomyces sp. bgisy029]|uniref:hypothetical protein n=1 Tax=Streptomyces sp. bgisy029 TaxID=3413771 RepID=UPI003D714719